MGEATFSACFGAPFLVWHPYVYAEMLAAKLEKVGASAYLVSTGWVGGPYGTGSRCSLKYTRQLIDAIHDGSLQNIEWEEMPVFGLMQPKMGIKDVPKDILRPQDAWTSSGKSAEEFNKTALNLAGLFQKNFKEFAPKCSPAVWLPGPKCKSARVSPSLILPAIGSEIACCEM